MEKEKRDDVVLIFIACDQRDSRLGCNSSASCETFGTVCVGKEVKGGVSLPCYIRLPVASMTIVFFSKAGSCPFYSIRMAQRLSMQPKSHCAADLWNRVFARGDVWWGSQGMPCWLNSWAVSTKNVLADISFQVIWIYNSTHYLLWTDIHWSQYGTMHSSVPEDGSCWQSWATAEGDGAMVWSDMLCVNWRSVDKLALLQAMTNVDDDATITQLATAWVGTAVVRWLISISFVQDTSDWSPKHPYREELRYRKPSTSIRSLETSIASR